MLASGRLSPFPAGLQARWVPVKNFPHFDYELRLGAICKRVGYERLLRSVRNFGAIGIEDHCEDNNAASDHLPDEIANTDQD